MRRVGPEKSGPFRFAKKKFLCAFLSEMRIGFILLILILSYCCSSQVMLDDVKVDSIPFKKVRSYLENQKGKSILGFSEMKAGCTAEVDLANYNRCTKKYRVKATLDEVWNAYVYSDPMTSWKTGKSATGLVYSRNTGKLSYPGESLQMTSPGQVLFLNLKLAKGLFKMATAFEILEVAKERSEISFSYLDTGKTLGRQEVRFFSENNGNTRIEHTSWVYSDSKLRDKVLYPFFHKKLINAFHRKMKSGIDKKKV